MRRFTTGAGTITRFAPALALGLALAGGCGEEPDRHGSPDRVAVDDESEGDEPTELVNVNPDPNGEPWLAGGTRRLTEEEEAQIPELVIVEAYAGGTALPQRVDNSQSKHFPPIFSQKGGSCAQASGVGYIYTYEINALRGADAKLAENRYPPGFTYNFLNSGSNTQGTTTAMGWDLIRRNGIPSVARYGGAYLADATRWISGHGVYRAGMRNRIERSYRITVGSDPAKLSVLKQWLYDHGKGTAAGGLAEFSVTIHDARLQLIPPGLPEAGKRILTRWGTSASHAMTLVGFDDRVRFDFNGDGKFTNDRDLNGDGVVDLRDWEKGALIVVNSFGTGWGSGGKAYLPYRLFPEVYGGSGYVVEVADGKPKLTLRLKLTHAYRERLGIRLWPTNDLAAPVPSSGVSLVYPQSFFSGSFPVRGVGDNRPIELEYDVTSCFDPAKIDLTRQVKVMLQLQDNHSKKSQPGSLLEWAVVDYRKNAQGVVLAHKAPNAAILSGQKTNLSLVLGASANLKPIAAAGPDRTVEGGQTVILDGSGSHDPDGSLKAYRWEQTSGTQVSLSNATKVKAQLVTPKVSAQASLTFRLTVTDSSGLTASDTVTVTVKPEQSQVVTVGETDTVVIAQTGKAQWHTVQLARSFANPVVLAQVVTKNGGHPVTVRIKDVTAKSFKLQLDEWEYLDQSHVQETVAYAVLERGRHVLADNTVIEVGTRKAFLQASAVSFEKAFGLRPVVVAQVQTANDARAVVTRLDKVSTSGFQVKLQGEEKNTAHDAEVVGYIAVQTSSKSTIEIARISKINHEWSYIQFSQQHAGTPVLLAAIQTLAGGDTASLRFKDLSKSGVSVFIEEEQSGDSETKHTREDVGYVLLPVGFMLGTSTGP